PTAAADGVALGLARYPGAAASDAYDASACAIDAGEFMPPTLDAADALLAALPPEDAQLVGAAPLRQALFGAIDLLPEGGPESPRAVLVITHSAPNCANAAPDTATLLEGLDPGVAPLADLTKTIGLPLFLITVGATPGASPELADKRPDGVDLSVYPQQLNTTASLNPTDEAMLLADLKSLLTVSSDSSCLFSLDPDPDPDLQHIAEVRIGGEPVPGPVADCPSQTGWRQSGPTELELCAGACDLFAKALHIEIDIACNR
ncbi:MAG TPA: hypothetical protein VGB85_26935, partial [Nannocystis sp.]